jgi:MutS domain V
LILLAVSVVAGVWILAYRLGAIYWLLIPVILLVFLVVIHERVIRTLRRCSRVIAFYERGLARIRDQWPGTGETGDRFSDPTHVYSRDLDLFGKGSLFELLCTSRTRAGEETLANWLLAPACPEEVRLRHAAICELRARLDLREDLAVVGERVRSASNLDILATWGEKNPLVGSKSVRIVLTFLASLWIVGLVAWAIWDIKYIVLLTAVVNVGVAYKFRDHIRMSVPAIEEATHDLGVLSAVLARLERETFSTSKLVSLQTSLQKDGMVASRCIAQLNRRVDFLISRRGLIVKVFDSFALWTLQWSFSIEAWRNKYGPSIRCWLAALGELEALSSLAGYAYEHPDDVFPQFTEGAMQFEAEALAHPLIPESRAQRNDLRLGDELRFLIISGPNMAGKSTFARAVGINAVLAQCGAPVRARRLCLSRLNVGASVCVLDSLQGGLSRFYAEISRLKLIIDLTNGASPVLFLLDELLQGTNSHDRRIGAEAILRSLFRKGAIGLMTTHDLALAEIADSFGSHAANFHFQDRLEDGKLRFDYHLSPGIVQTSNALELMKSIGLDV